MNDWKIFVIVLIGNVLVMQISQSQADGNAEVTWFGNWNIDTTTPTTMWSLHSRIPMSTNSLQDDNDYDEDARKKGGFKVKKKYRKFLLPLLVAYKLKFFTLIPVLIGGLLLLTGATGLAGFFFALFAATVGINKH